MQKFHHVTVVPSTRSVGSSDMEKEHSSQPLPLLLDHVRRPTRCIMGHFIRKGDTIDDVRAKAAMLEPMLITSVLFMLLFSLWHAPAMGTSGYAKSSLLHSGDEPKPQMLAAALVDMFMLVCHASTVVCLKAYGATTMVRCFFTLQYLIGATISSIVWASFPCNLLVTLPIPVLFVLEAPGNKKVMRFMMYVHLAVFVILSCLDTYERAQQPTNETFAYHPWRAEEAFSWRGWALCVILPPIINFIIMKSYSDGLRKSETRMQACIQLGRHISESLANYDLHAAEQLLASEDVVALSKPMGQLLRNLRCYRSFLPHALFSSGNEDQLAKCAECNGLLVKRVAEEKTSWQLISAAVDQVLDPCYTLPAFQHDMCQGFPELELYKQHSATSSSFSPATTAGRSCFEEYERTIGALSSIYCLLRLGIDGRQIMSFGVDQSGSPITFSTLHARDPKTALKKQKFFETMPWDELALLLRRAEIWGESDQGELFLRKERVIALLALTAIHDIMKITSFAPVVLPQHGSYAGYGSGEVIKDHDAAISYILTMFPGLLPSFKGLEPGQRAPILFAQSEMGFNNGQLVQGEAPPGEAFSKLKRAIIQGGASEADVSFYFIHWFTDLAGGEPFQNQPWPGAEKLTLCFPVKVLMAFLESFSFVDKLATCSEVEVMEEYLVSRWSAQGPPLTVVPVGCEVAAMRLSLMAQGFEREIVSAFVQLPSCYQVLLARELSITGCMQRYRIASLDVNSSPPTGPAILVYYAPAMVQKATARHCKAALVVLAQIFGAARLLFPLDTQRVEETVIIRIDALKVLDPTDIVKTAPWYLKRTSRRDAEAVRAEQSADLHFDTGDMVQLTFPTATLEALNLESEAVELPKLPSEV
eukprot:TRINITY_DN7560_c0_g1_i1.p1 TRINITY_DN7560_c0_g1~~TRINITY_DN7560_c0_g1_i1.p1  ORF type:complete len:874 (-),score=118.32 TRINITY_DN7560_c0_g1_i1:166-2787(-)